MYPNGLVVNREPYSNALNGTKDIGVVRIGSCPRNVFAVVVGGGGSRRDDYGGGGSGYIQAAELSGPYLPYSNLRVNIGRDPRIPGSADGSSTVRDGSGNVVLAQGGEPPYYNDGGSGYSGGGAGADAVPGSGLTRLTIYLRPQKIILAVLAVINQTLPCAGGSDGNDGEAATSNTNETTAVAGTGSGFDVSTIPLKGFTIT